MLSILTLRPFPDLALLREGQGGWGCLNKSSTKKQLQCCEEWDLSVICCLKPRRLQVWGRLEFWACSAVWEKQWEGKHHPLWGNYWNYQRPAPVPANDNPTPHHSLSPCNWYTQSHSLTHSRWVIFNSEDEFGTNVFIFPTSCPHSQHAVMKNAWIFLWLIIG